MKGKSVRKLHRLEERKMPDQVCSDAAAVKVCFREWSEMAAAVSRSRRFHGKKNGFMKGAFRMLDFIIDRLGDLAEFFIYLWSEKVFKKPSKKKNGR